MRRSGVGIALAVLLTLSLGNVSPAQTQENAAKTFEEDALPNIIVMIGDGMGFEQLKAASLVEYGALNQTILDLAFPVMDTYGTNDIDDRTTDSAASGTSLATGQRTSSGSISMSKDESWIMKSILEYLSHDYGYATGIVTNTELTHATPAVYASHTDDRDNKEIILEQMVARDVDLLLGGGLEFSKIGESGAKFHGGNNGYDTVFNRDDLFEAIEVSEKLMGVFGYKPGETNIPYETERNATLDPSMLELTESAIKFLDNKENPFFLMVESGRIDHAGHLTHANNETKSYKTVNNVIETIMFEKSIRAAYEYAVADGNTIIIVCADHETGGFEVLDFTNLDDDLPSESNSREENNAIRERRALQLDIFWLWNAHTDVEVPFFMYGADLGSIKLNHSIDVFWALNQIMGSFPVPLEFHFTPIDTIMNVWMQFDDRDHSFTSADIMVKTSESTTAHPVNVTTQGGLYLIDANVTIPAGDHSIFVRITDGNQTI
ncbi:MAG: alkaline phosphatase, partial [Candidatus Kariarchaeaceae archaeon]